LRIRLSYLRSGFAPRFSGDRSHCDRRTGRRSPDTEQAIADSGISLFLYSLLTQDSPCQVCLRDGWFCLPAPGPQFDYEAGVLPDDSDMLTVREVFQRAGDQAWLETRGWA
jgi:hypothetical protein